MWAPHPRPLSPREEGSVSLHRASRGPLTPGPSPQGGDGRDAKSAYTKLPLRCANGGKPLSWAVPQLLVGPFRHCDMNFLRSSPFRALSPASLLQAFIFSCWLILAADRHSDMNFLRSSPFSALSPASLLHVAIFSC